MEIKTFYPKTPKNKCSRCGKNLYNIRIAFKQKHEYGYSYADNGRSNPKNWQGPYYRPFYSANVYLCFDCAAEVMIGLAKCFLDEMKKPEFSYRNVHSCAELEELANLKHQRKADKVKKQEIKIKQSHTGLDVVSEVL